VPESAGALPAPLLRGNYGGVKFPQATGDSASPAVFLLAERTGRESGALAAHPAQDDNRRVGALVDGLDEEPLRLCIALDGADDDW
jgi:hypothetical protein